jgi:hypothetical protein
MFVSLARHIRPRDPEAGARFILRLDAPTIAFLMEAAWSTGGPGLLPGMPNPPRVPIGVDLRRFSLGGTWSALYDHLIYAFMVENTGIYEIFGRVIWEYGHGERLGFPQSNATFQWIRTTEEIFYKDASPFQTFNQISRLRPDIAATRRNAYYRFFGADLNHGRDRAVAYAYTKPPAANREFIPTFEEFLREVWRAIENARNRIAGNPTDFPAIADLALRLQNMLNARRGGSPAGPVMARDEFLAVCLASWLDLTVQFNTPVVGDLVATGPSPEERLRQIGDRVGRPAHARSHSYFIIAPLVSTLLIEIERGDYSTVPGARNLAAAGTIRDAVSQVIHHWTIISGRDMKSLRMTMGSGTPTSRPMAPTPTHAGTTSASAVVGTPGGNGKVPVESA